MAAQKPTIQVSVELSQEAKRRVEQQIDDLKRKIQDRTRTHGADDPQVKDAKDLLRTIQQLGNAQERATKNTRSFVAEIRNAASSAAQAAQSLNVLDGPGGGAASGLLSAGAGLLRFGPAALVGSAALVIGMAMKMALEFERTSTRAAQNLSIGGDNFASNLSAIRRASWNAGQPYGIGVHEMAQTIGAYAASSGNQDAPYAAVDLAKYARGYGIDPTLLGTMVGTITQATQERAGTAMDGIFGAAEGAGPMGRRITEFIGTATAVLSQLQQQNTSQDFSAGSAAALVRNIAQLGGIFGTSQGVQMTLGAAGGLMSGTDTDIRKTALAVRAGIRDPYSLIFGVKNPQNEAKMFAELEREFGPASRTNSNFMAALSAAAGGPDAGRVLFDAAMRARSRGTSLESVLTNLNPGHSRVDQRVADYKSTPVFIFDKVSADIENTMTKWGDNINEHLLPAMRNIDKAITNLSPDLINATNDLNQFQQAVERNGKWTHDALGSWFNQHYATATTADSGAIFSDPSWMRGNVWGPGSINAGMLGEYKTRFSGKFSGITNALRSEINELTARGYNLFISSMNDSTHYGPAHYQGRAMDVAALNGEALRYNYASDNWKRFADDVLRGNPRTKVGTYGKLYDYLRSEGYGDRVFSDQGSGPHLHIQVEGEQNEAIDIGSGQVLHVQHRTVVTGRSTAANAGPRTTRRSKG